MLSRGAASNRSANNSAYTMLFLGVSQQIKSPLLIQTIVWLLSPSPLPLTSPPSPLLPHLSSLTSPPSPLLPHLSPSPLYLPSVSIPSSHSPSLTHSTGERRAKNRTRVPEIDLFFEANYVYLIIWRRIFIVLTWICSLSWICSLFSVVKEGDGMRV